MKVKKRNDTLVDMKFDSITTRLKKLTLGLSPAISADKISQQVCSSLYDGISTTEIDTFTAEIAIGLITEDPDYEVLATRIVTSNLNKIVPKTFSEAMRLLHRDGCIISDQMWKIVSDNRSALNAMIVKDRLLPGGYFGVKTLEKGYLMKIKDGDRLVECPQYLFLRVSLGIHGGDDLDKVKETYDMMSLGKFIHATPTLFNSATPRPQMSSCFLVAMKDDSIDGIYDTLKETAQISKWAGGIGLHIHNVRASKSRIRGTNGVSDGIVPMLKVFNSTARYVNQSGRRKGSMAVYLEPWHPDVMDFLELRLNQGDEEYRTRDLFTALWIPDLFMERVQTGGTWSLFCPDRAPGLADVYGDEFNTLYTKYEQTEGLANKIVPALTVWKAMIKSQSETGTPYMVYKDACNRKSNQKNLGTIKSSNLCTEIVEYSDKDETAVCNLASLALPQYVDGQVFDHPALHQATRILTRNLNKVIDVTYYPVEEARRSNTRHRPIGIGVQGLADVFMILGLPFDSPKAKELNIAIFETIYHAAVLESMDLAINAKMTYETFHGSPASEGKLQFDLWDKPKFSGLYDDWVAIKKKVKKHGLLNSLLVAPMPTASTSQILGNNEAIEPYTTNLYLRRTLAGEFVVVNKHLVRELQSRGLWSKEIKDQMVRDSGSIQNIQDIPPDVKDVYRTVWEIPQKSLIDMARDRGCFIDQSQSLNLFIESPTVSRLSSMHMYAWKSGLKTGMYYLRSKAKARPIQFSIEPECQSCSA